MSAQGVAPWLVGSRWPTVPIRLVARLGSGHTPSRSKPEYWENCSIPWVTLSDVWQFRTGEQQYVWETNEMISQLGLTNSAATLHAPGTVILSRTASVGFSAIMGSEMATSQDFATWTCGPRLDPRFLLHVLRGMAPDLRRISMGSTHKTIYMPDIEQLRTPVPPVKEQRRIADFLDAETSRIDKIVHLRQKQISLMEDAAFTRAFDAIRGAEIAGKRKSSGLGWLGDIPETWRVAAISHLFEVDLGKMLNQDRVSGSHLRPYLRVANVQWGVVDTGELAMMDFPPDEQERYRLRVGDLLVCEGGSWPGRSAIWDGSIEEIYYQKALHRIRPRYSDLAEWLYYCLLVAERMRVFAIQGNSSTMTHLTREQLKPQRLPFPEPVVQKQLVRSLDRAAADAQTAIGLLRRQLSLLTERRHAIITAAVTGQFDVSTASGRNTTQGV